MTSTTFFSLFYPIFSIIILDLVLSGDNAAVIGNGYLPVASKHQKKGRYLRYIFCNHFAYYFYHYYYTYT